MKKMRPVWVKGSVNTGAGNVSVASTVITSSERWEHFKSRVSAYRNSYTVEPGLYALGSPESESEVLVTSNYKLSFDHLRRAAHGLDVWVLVLETGGINVWCAAGKGTFATGELVARMEKVSLDKVVSHRRLILPQLGAVGVSAHEVKAATGFRVHYGPVRARDIKQYLGAGRKATGDMRRVRFTLWDRLVLTPMEVRPALAHFPKFALIVFVLFGLDPEGIIFRDALTGGFPVLGLGILTVLSGALLTPALLPYVPFRAFSLKGYIIGLPVVWLGLRWLLPGAHWVLLAACLLWFPIASSYIALQFTGSTTFTGMSGVEKELRIGFPVYIGASVITAALLVVYKVIQFMGGA